MTVYFHMKLYWESFDADRCSCYLKGINIDKMQVKEKKKIFWR